MSQCMIIKFIFLWSIVMQVSWNSCFFQQTLNFINKFHFFFIIHMGLVSKILNGKEPELRDYILPIAVVSVLCVSGAYMLVESDTPKKVYNSAIDLAYLVISDSLSR